MSLEDMALANDGIMSRLMVATALTNQEALQDKPAKLFDAQWLGLFTFTWTLIFYNPPPAAKALMASTCLSIARADWSELISTRRVGVLVVALYQASKEPC